MHLNVGKMNCVYKTIELLHNATCTYEIFNSNYEKNQQLDDEDDGTYVHSVTINVKWYHGATCTKT